MLSYQRFAAIGNEQCMNYYSPYLDFFVLLLEYEFIAGYSWGIMLMLQK